MEQFEYKTLEKLKAAVQKLEKPDFSEVKRRALQAEPITEKEVFVQKRPRPSFQLISAMAAVLLLAVGAGLWQVWDTERGNDSYKAVYEAMQQVTSHTQKYGMDTVAGAASAETKEDIAPADGGQANGETAGNTNTESGTKENDYGATNIQVSGVDEADIVKNDGNNLYILSQNPYGTGESLISVVRLSDQKLLSQLKVTSGEYQQVQEMYVRESRLVLVGEKAVTEDSTLVNWDNTGTKAEIYEIDAQGNLQQLRSFEQEGSYITSRMADGNLYLVSSKQLYFTRRIYQSDMENLVPKKLDSLAGEVPVPIASDCIAIAEYPENLFTVISALSITEDKPADTKSILGASGTTVYCSSENLYLLSYKSGWDSDTAALMKYALSGASVTYVAETQVPGYVNDQFSLDESGGYLRVAVTQRKTGGNENFLYIYDENLQLAGKTEGLAKDESIKSVRYIGDMAYMVTFRQTDPLFAIDVSDPANPKVLGELKIPGFSTYLHPMDEETLIGIGFDTDETGNVTTGLKISLFGVTDPMNPVELAKLTLSGDCYSEAAYNHKAVTWIAQDGLLLLPVSSAGRTQVQGQALPVTERAYALALSVSKDQGIRIKGIVQDTKNSESTNWMEDSQRAILRITYAGDTLYTVSAQSVIAVNKNTLALENQLDLFDKETYSDTSVQIEPYTNYVE